MSKSKIAVLSDIHIGTNAPTVWYQKTFHEPYLVKVLDHIIENAESYQELILLGDVVDFWTYPPNEQPPNFEEIMEANPNIFGPKGKLNQVLNALEGKVTYILGNHDINLTQDDLNKISLQGSPIKLHPDYIYYPLGENNKKIACTHGHLFTMFNAPDKDKNNPWPPLPVGHFVTRSVAYMTQRILKPGQTVADLPDQGAPNGIDLTNLVKSLSPDNPADFSITQTLLNYILKETGMPENQEVILPDGKKTTVGEAKKIYNGLWSQWADRYSQLVAFKAAIADATGDYIAWFAQKLAFEVGADLVIMGHTHIPKLDLKQSLIQYANSGFECPSKPDVGKKHPTFVEIDIENYQAKLFQVVNQGGVYSVQAAPAKPDSIVVSPAEDFSCYVIIDNTKGSSELTRTSLPKPKHGHYTVEPPETIAPGQEGRFWIQDYPGINGSEGQVTYSFNDDQTTLKYECPLVSNNSCSGAKFYTKSVDAQTWGELNHKAGRGHPFFIKFVF